jgi:branched-chain amino acid transport system substrate-binding protein
MFYRLSLLFPVFLLLIATFASLPAQEKGTAGSEFLIGSSLPLTGAFAAVGQATKEGMEAAFRAVNETGGVNGRRLRLVAYSDGYDPLLCVQNTLQLINTDNVFALCSYVGTPTSLKAQPVWQGAKVPVVGFYTGARALREPFNRYNIHVRASYAQETAAAVEAFSKHLGAKRYAILYQDDSFGDAVKMATERALAAKGLAPVAYGNFVRGALNVEEQMTRIAAARPDVVVLAGTYAPSPRRSSSGNKRASRRPSSTPSPSSARRRWRSRWGRRSTASSSPRSSRSIRTHGSRSSNRIWPPCAGSSPPSLPSRATSTPASSSRA